MDTQKSRSQSVGLCLNASRKANPTRIKPCEMVISREEILKNIDWLLSTHAPSVMFLQQASKAHNAAQSAQKEKLAAERAANRPWVEK